MAIEHIEALGMNEDQVRALADFYEAYADMVASELLTSPGRASDTSMLAVRRQEEAVWALQMDVASSLREAGQWLALVDPIRATEFLRRAGRNFWRHGHAFGLFMMAQFASPSRPRGKVRSSGLEDQMDLAARMLGVIGGMSMNRDVPVPVPVPMLHPQQQAYALLTVAADRTASERQGDVLRSMIERSPHRDGVVPVGALGVPIRHWWELARLMLDDEPLGPEHVAPFLTRYTEMISSARENAFLWRGGAAPVDVIDVDVMGIVVAAARRFGPDRVGLLAQNAPFAGSMLLDLSLSMYRRMTG